MGDAETKLVPQTVVQDVRVSSPGVCRIMTQPTPPPEFNQVTNNMNGRDFYKQRYDKHLGEMAGKQYPSIGKSMDYSPTPTYQDQNKMSSRHHHSEEPIDLAHTPNYDFGRSGHLYEGRGIPPPYPPGSRSYPSGKGKQMSVDDPRTGTSAIENLVQEVFTDFGPSGGRSGCSENSRYSSSSLSSPSHSLGTPTSPDVPMMTGSMGRGDSPRSNATMSPPSSYTTSPKLISQPPSDAGSPYWVGREREKRPAETEGSPEESHWDHIGGGPPKKSHSSNEPPVPSIKEEVDDSLPVMQPQIHSQHESQHHISMSSDSRGDRRKNSGETLVRHCQICNDVASGFHYGVWSCEGCKAFFKRSIQGPVDYVCPATNTCTIDKHRRKSCQACRLRKCLEMGMTKGASNRKERGSGGPRVLQRGNQKKKISQENHINSSSEEHRKEDVKVKKERVITDPLVAVLVKADPPIICSQHNTAIPDSDFHIMSSLMKLADKELVYMINWAKQIPGYVQLSLNDQVHLLESSWLELLTIGCAHRSMKYKGEKLEFAPDLVLDKNRCQIAGVAEVCELVSAIAQRFCELGLTHEEFVILKAMALVNAEAKPLTSMEKIIVMQRQLMDALHHVVSIKFPSDSVRIQELLLLMPHIRQVSLRGIAHMFDFKNEAAVPLCDLLLEMLDSQQVVMRHNKDGHPEGAEDQQSPAHDSPPQAPEPT